MNNESTINERRSALRYSVNYPSLVELIYVENAAVNKVSARYTNCSLEGLTIQSDTLIPEGQVVQLIFSPPGLDRPLQIKGKVIWNKMMSDKSGNIKKEYLTGVKYEKQ